MKELFLVFARQYFSFPAMAVVRGSLESWNWLAAIYTLRKTIINVLWIYAPGFGAAVWCQNDPQPPLGELFFDSDDFCRSAFIIGVFIDSRWTPRMNATRAQW